MVKKPFAIILIAGAIGITATPAMAQFGKLLGGGATASASSSSTDPDAFVASAKTAEKLMNDSLQLLSSTLSSKEEAANLEAKRKAANESTKTEEKNAKLLEIAQDQKALVNAALSNANIDEQVKKMDAKQRETLGVAAFNFMLALLKDKALIEQGQGVISGLSSNPMNITKLGGVKDVVGSLTRQISDASAIAGSMPKIFTAVGVKAPTSAEAKPQEMTSSKGD